MTEPGPTGPHRQPIFNLPGVVTALLALIIGIHAARYLILSPEQDFELLAQFAFIPARITDPAMASALPGGEGAVVWSFATYAFLHGNLTHLVMNGIYMAAFASPLARRFGTVRFLAFSLLITIAAAIASLMVHQGEAILIIGASGAISGHLAAASRFLFASGAPLGRVGGASHNQPAMPLLEVLTDRRTLTFLAVWFALNLFFGLTSGVFGITSGAVAWEAHLGGFLAGLVLFPLLDPVGPGHSDGRPDEGRQADKSE